MRSTCLVLSQGKDSSDDEDLNDIPDDDQYDTEDSFIDDAELVSLLVHCSYFQVYVDPHAALIVNILQVK